MRNKYKVNVVVPIYNSLEWLKLCVDGIFKNTNMDIINKVYLIDDCSNEETKEWLVKTERRYGQYVKVIFNKNNLGFVKTCNKGLRLSLNDQADYVLLLNTDCVVSKKCNRKDG